jgi:hypothetical protein
VEPSGKLKTPVLQLDTAVKQIHLLEVDMGSGIVWKHPQGILLFNPGWTVVDLDHKFSNMWSLKK